MDKYKTYSFIALHNVEQIEIDYQTKRTYIKTNVIRDFLCMLRMGTDVSDYCVGLGKMIWFEVVQVKNTQ